MNIILFHYERKRPHIHQATLTDLDTLLAWRMEVLHCVFSLSADADTTPLRQANEAYYRQQLPQGGHIACFAYMEEESLLRRDSQSQGKRLAVSKEETGSLKGKYFSETAFSPVGCGGLCLYDEMPSPDNPSSRCAYLMNIYVRPAHRGRGVAKRIVRWLVGQALQQGITKIYLETSEAGRILYEVLGFSEMKDMMCLGFQG